MIRLGTHAPDYDLTHVSDAFMGQAMYIGSHSYEILNSELASQELIGGRAAGGRAAR